MVHITIGLTLGFAFVIPPILYIQSILGKDKKLDFFNPNIIVPVFWLLKVPFLIAIGINGNSIISYEVRSVVGSKFTSISLYYAVLTLSSFAALMIGVKSKFASYISKKLPLIRVKKHSTSSGLYLSVVYILAFGFFVYSLWDVGLYILYNSSLRTRADLGGGYIIKFVRYTFILCSLLVVHRFVAGKNSKATLFLVLSVTFILLASYGGRSHAVVMLFSCLLLYLYKTEYNLRKYSRNSYLRGLSLVVISGIFMVVFVSFISALRSTGGLYKLASGSSSVLDETVKSLDVIIERGSGYERKALLIDHFDSGQFWHGRSYVDLLYAPFPSSLFESPGNKPPVNEGYYIFSLSRGQSVSPSTARESVRTVTAWPIGNWVGYANFWVPGLLVYFYISGMIIRLLYDYIYVSRYSLFSIFLYSALVFRGVIQLSNPGLIRIVFILFFSFILLYPVSIITLNNRS